MTLAKPEVRFKVTQINRDRRWLNLLVYGLPGAGKTRLLATACEEKSAQDLLFIDAEAGDETLVEFEDNKHIVIMTCTSQQAIADAYKFVAGHCQLREGEQWDKLKQWNELYGIPEHFVFRSVALDSLTEINQLIMYKLLGVDVSTFKATDLDSELETAEYKDWNVGGEMTKLTVRAFRNLPIHVLIACGAADGKSKDNEPDLPGKLARRVQGFVDVVGYLEAGKLTADAEKDTHRLFLTQSPKRDAKSRLVNLDDAYLDNTDMATIIAKARKKG